MRKCFRPLYWRLLKSSSSLGASGNSKSPASSMSLQMGTGHRRKDIAATNSRERSIEAILQPQLGEASKRGVWGGHRFPRGSCASVDVHSRSQEATRSPKPQWTSPSSRDRAGPSPLRAALYTTRITRICA